VANRFNPHFSWRYLALEVKIYVFGLEDFVPEPLRLVRNAV
jgi:hypothetical protein